MMRRTSRSGGIRFATRNNSRIAYDPGTSASSAAESPVVVMLHALLTDHTEFGAIREQLTDRFRVILPDARGHGASPTLQNQWYSVAELAADLVAVLDAEGIESAHLVGHGLGGTIAFDFARRHPERVRSLVLIEPELGAILDNDPRPEIRAAWTERRTSDRAAGDAAYKQLVDRSLDGFVEPRWGQNWRTSLTKPRMGAIRRHAPALAGILPALDSYQITRPEAGDLIVLTLLVVGAEADTIEQTIVERLDQWLPRSEIKLASIGSRADGVIRGSAATSLSSLLLEFWTSEKVG